MTNIAGEFGFKSKDTGMDAIGVSIQDLGARAAMFGSTSMTSTNELEFGTNGQNFDELNA